MYCYPLTLRLICGPQNRNAQRVRREPDAKRVDAFSRLLDGTGGTDQYGDFALQLRPQSIPLDL